MRRRNLILAVRLALGAPVARRRFAMTASGVGLAATFLLAASCVLPVLENRNARVESRTPTLSRTTDRTAGTLLVRTGKDHFEDDQIVVYRVARLRDAAQTPPGLVDLPAPGQVVVSPGMAALEQQPGGEALRRRYPGTRVGAVTAVGLIGPHEAVVWMGVDSADFAPDDLVAQGWGAVPQDRLTVPGALRLAVPIGVIGLLVPVLALVVSASRWGTSERDRRMAALRLVGLTATEVRRATAAEAWLAGVAGVTVSLIVFFAARLVIAPWLPVDGGAFASDVSPPAAAVFLVCLGLPVLVAAASAWGQRRLRLDPLGVVRKVHDKRPSRSGLAPLAIGALALAGVLVTHAAGVQFAEEVLFLVAAVAFVLVLVGLYVAAPLWCWIVARAVGRLDLGPTLRLVSRRAEASPGATARVVSAVTLVVFGSTSMLAFLTLVDPGNVKPLLALRAEVGGKTLRANLDPAVTRPVLADAEATALIRQVILTTPAFPDGIQVSLTDCQQLNELLNNGLPDCSPGRSTLYFSPDSPPEIAAAFASPSNGTIIAEGPETAKGISRRPVAAVHVPTGLAGGLRGLESLNLGAALLSTDTFLATPGAVVSQQLLATPRTEQDVEPLRTQLALARGRAIDEILTVDEELAQATRSSDTIRRAIITVLLVAAAVSAVSLAVTLLDRMLAGSRSLAALRAAGLPLRILRRAVLGESVLMVLPAVALGALAAAPAAAALLVAAGAATVQIDLDAAALVAATAALLVLIVNALLLPAVDRATALGALAGE